MINQGKDREPKYVKIREKKCNMSSKTGKTQERREEKIFLVRDMTIKKRKSKRLIVKMEIFAKNIFSTKCRQITIEPSSKNDPCKMKIASTPPLKDFTKPRDFPIT